MVWRSCRQGSHGRFYVDLQGLLHRDRSRAIPLLKTAQLKGRPRSWPSEQLERLLTPSEIELVRHGQI